jgi:hypothetical protein
VDDDAGRLVDHQQVVVLVGDPKRHLFALERLRRGRLELDRLSALEAVALRSSGPVDPDGACSDDAFRRRARADLGQLCEKAVEPLARRRIWDADANCWYLGRQTAAPRRCPGA